MSSIAGPLFLIAFFTIVVCICCRCLSFCFKKRRLNQGLIISSTTTPAANISGQNVHVISQPAQPQFNNPYQIGQTPYQPAQYPPASYSSPYPPNQYGDFNQPPPPYSNPTPIYPPPFKTETNQTSANDKQPAPSAPEF